VVGQSEVNTHTFVRTNYTHTIRVLWFNCMWHKTCPHGSTRHIHNSKQWKIQRSPNPSSPFTPRFFKKQHKTWTHKATYNRAYFLKHNLFCITGNWNVVSSNIAVLQKLEMEYATLIIQNLYIVVFGNNH